MPRCPGTSKRGGEHETQVDDLRFMSTFKYTRPADSVRLSSHFRARSSFPNLSRGKRSVTTSVESQCPCASEETCGVRFRRDKPSQPILPKGALLAIDVRRFLSPILKLGWNELRRFNACAEMGNRESDRVRVGTSPAFV